MKLTYFQKFIQTFSFEGFEGSAYQFYETSIKAVEEFEIGLTNDLSGLSSSKATETLSHFKYSLERKISEHYYIGYERIQFWLNQYGLTFDELINKPDNDLVQILSYNDKTDVKIFESLQAQNEHFETIRDDFVNYWCGWQIYRAIEIINKLEKSLTDINTSSKIPFLPIRLGKDFNKNELPSYFYNLLIENKIDSSKANTVRMLKFVFRDSEGKELSESYFTDIMNPSKKFARSKKGS